MRYLLLISTLALALGCGKSGTQWVTDFNYQTDDQDDQKWIVSDMKLNIGDNELPDLNVPLPRDYGYFRSWRLNGENYLGVDVNLSEVLGLPGQLATLPNGQAIPVDTNGVGVIEVPIENINGKIYAAVANGTTLLGVAVSISQLDDLKVGEIGVFPRFNIKGVDVMAGVFASESTGKTGLAIFATIGGIWEDTVKMGPEVFEWRTEYVTRSKRRRLARKLRRQMRRRMQLDFVER
ncbi:MAG: hypothetical protein CME65_06905 [Halobacteriovoraceae bacterium]|nr:hypothetical protein [Halobacteriovoraceae bacterium]|tara:strand:- start:2744 stop:3451 length:708 start_codon:yes stop_codon:yes gene_type:complete